MKLPYTTVKTAPFCPKNMIVFQPKRGEHIRAKVWRFECVFCAEWHEWDFATAGQAPTENAEIAREVLR